MKDMTLSLMNHLKGETTYCAELIRITRRDGVRVGLTDHDRDITYGGVLYRADGSFESGRMRQSGGLKAESYAVTGILSGAAIEEADVAAGLYDFARIDVYLCNWSDLSQGVIHLRRGFLGEVRCAGGEYAADLRGFQDLLDRKACEAYTPECRFDLGDGRCGVNLEALSVTGRVTGVLDELSFYDFMRSEAGGTFQDARLTWLSGANVGVSAEVRLWDAGAKCFSLWVAMDHPVAVGDSYRVAAGCDKRFATCKARFNNVVRYGGFPHLPGIAKILDYPESRS
jgi:uncharacterized phage protein (TIGR02218 family)